MKKLGWWSALLFGFLLVSISSMAMADRGYSGHGGYDGHGGYGGHGGYDGHGWYGGGHGGYDWHGQVGVGVVVNPFWFDPWVYPGPYLGPYPAPYYYPPYYYPPSVVTVPGSPPVYIEREESSQPVPKESAYWYYCANPQGYYPYVKECPGGWQAVAPLPPGQPR